MAQGLNNEIVLGYEQFLFIGGAPIAGAQSVQYSYTLPKQFIYALGGIDTLSTSKGFNKGQLSVNTLLIGQDIFLPLTGENGVNGVLIKDLNNKFDNFGFISGYLTNYSNQYSLGALPQINASFDIYNDLGIIGNDNDAHIINEINNLTYTSSGVFNYPHQGCLTITSSDFNDNPLLGYDINITCGRTPFYPIGHNSPAHVLLNRPIETTVTLQFEDSVYNHFNMANHPYESSKRNITISLQNKNNQSINKYVFGDMQLIDVSRQTNTDTPNTVSLTYKKAS